MMWWTFEFRDWILWKFVLSNIWSHKIYCRWNKKEAIECSCNAFFLKQNTSAFDGTRNILLWNWFLYAFYAYFWNGALPEKRSLQFCHLIHPTHWICSLPDIVLYKTKLCFAVENLSIEGTRSKIKVSLHDSHLWQLWERVFERVVHVVNSHLLFIFNVTMNLLRWYLLASYVICDLWPAFLPTRRKNESLDHHAAHVNCVPHWQTEPFDNFR